MSDDRVWNRFVWNKGDVQILKRSIVTAEERRAAADRAWNEYLQTVASITTPDAQVVEAADPDELMDEIDRILESLVRGGE